MRVLHKRRWTAATAFLLVLGSVTTYTFTVTPIYEARTRLLIEADDPNVINFTEVIDEQGAKADYYQTQYNILQSRALARKTVEGLQLWDHPLLSAIFGGAPATRNVGLAPIRRVSEVRRAIGRSGGDETLEQSKSIDASSRI